MRETTQVFCNCRKHVHIVIPQVFFVSLFKDLRVVVDSDPDLPPTCGLGGAQYQKGRHHVQEAREAGTGRSPRALLTGMKWHRIGWNSE